jgi:hypothetical protein
MLRKLLLGCGLSCVVAVLGCHTFNWTAGVCDCDPPPVASLLAEPKLPPHLSHAPVVTTSHELPVVRVKPGEPPVVTPPKAIENGKKP